MTCGNLYQDPSMDLISQSLEDINRASKLAQRQSKVAVKSKTTLRTTRTGRIAKSGPTHAQRVRKEEPLFTETYKALAAPVKEIFTSRYIPSAGPLKLVVINNKAIEARKAAGTARTSNLTTIPRNTHASTTSNDSTSRERQGYRGGDYYRPNSGRPINSHRERSRSRSGRSEPESRKNSNFISNNRPERSMNDTGDNRRNSNSNGNNIKNNNSSTRGERRSRSRPAEQNIKMEPSESPRVQRVKQHPLVSMDIDDQPISIKGAAPAVADLGTNSDNGPVTIEIENLDPGTTAEDVQVVCSRFGEIRSCICTNGFSQVTYARKAAGQAAVETLNGKKADNDQILRVTMRKTPAFHSTPLPATTHAPSAIAEPMKMLTKVMEGKIYNVGTLYQEQLQAAQHILKVQQHRMAQLRMEEQRIAALRMQTNGVYDT
ncbi:hypothetical protein BC939DRAFT_452143 [Gamsiella multidivaricata]|uniref:uncharacterized protein n=1 Tax=Gamsiella multidivaricata TaxID=101098 RepID=UPI00221F1996|nr:uncharacterized protein BC939DRAFT_452143 [Gamsiella multidivaricata]KAI7823209.1 hypothetical protein BC939DRAFT_452143 [Gamsiella multidivaricata]